MAEPIVAFDEAGNSGGNLVDRTQPVFVLASVCLSNDEAASLIATGTGEYKFSTLRRSRDGQRRVLNLLDAEPLQESQYVISAFHKPFMVITKIVDLLVEPLFHHAGHDLYERGANLAMANMLYFCLRALLGIKAFELLLQRFVTMVRSPSDGTIGKFYRLLETASRKHRDDDLAEEVRNLLMTRVIAQEYADTWDGSDLDPAIPAFVEHGSIWSDRLGGPFRIVHDNSHPILNEQIVLEAMMSTHETPVTVGYDRRKMTFPISALGIELHDSLEWPQIQVADIIASAVAYSLKAGVLQDCDPFCESLQNTKVLSGDFRPVWPEPKVSPEELGTDAVGGIDANDYVGDYVARRLGGIPPKGERRKKTN